MIFMGRKVTVGITQGDTNGIGYEIIIKALSDARITDMCVPVVYGSSKAFGYYRNMIPEIEAMHTNVITDARDAQPKRINIINCVPDNLSIDPGQRTADGSKAAVIALESATADLKAGHIDAMVTAPFNKMGVNDAGFNYPGHTEYLTDVFGPADSLMLLHSGNFRIGVVTGHIPVSQISECLDRNSIMSKLRVMNDSLVKDFNIMTPKIAVLGLNPHNGDGGLLGSEEETVITPAVLAARDEGILAFGPYPPDGFFGNGMQYRFDAVLAMYHDQGLIPFKAIAFDEGVNYTAGLSVVRTSPDHGTAYELAGQGKASAVPMLSAIYSAIDIVRNREMYHNLRKDVLKVKLSDIGGREPELKETPENE